MALYHLYELVEHVNGLPAPGQTITIYTAATGVVLATLYADSTGTTTLANPYTVPSTSIMDAWVNQAVVYIDGGSGVRTPHYLSTPSAAGVNVMDYGTVGDGVTDDAPAINAALAACPRAGTVYFPPVLKRSSPQGSYAIGSTLFVPWDVNVDFGWNVLAAIGTIDKYANGFMICLNSADGSTQIQPNPGYLPYEIKHVYIHNYNALVDLYGIFLASRHRIDGIYSSGFYQTVKQGGFYMDSIHISDVNIGNTHGTRYAIDLSAGQGDCCEVRRVAIGYPNDNLNLIKVAYKNGCRVEDCINGNYYFGRGGSTIVSGLHLEKGQIVVDGCEFSLDDLFVYKQETTVPLVIKPSTWDGTHRGATLSNCRFHIDYHDATNLLTQDTGDIELDDFASVTLRNCARCIGATGSLATVRRVGVYVVDKTGASLTEFNNNSSILSWDGVWTMGRLAGRSLLKTLSTGVGYALGQPAPVDPVYTSSGFTLTWRGASTTYYYHAVYVADPVRMIGRRDAVEFSFDQTGLTTLIKLPTPVVNTLQSGCNVRIYRGTAANTYSEYVDVPLVDVQGNALFDDGLMVNGYFWKDYGPANVPSFYLAPSTEFDLRNNVVRCTGTAAPTVGTWSVGDRVYNSAPSSGGKMGWICVTAGTPGTWVTFGEIDPYQIQHMADVPTSGVYQKGDIIFSTAAAPSGKVGWVCTTAGTAGIDAVFKPFGVIDA